MSKEKREKEAEILKKMLSDTDGEPKKDTAPKESGRKGGKATQPDEDDIIRCPKCGYVLSSRSSCPRCNYKGYVPMTKAETRKIKIILYPIVLIIVVLVILWQKGIIG